MIPPAQLKEWRALADAATPGPWHAPSLASGVRHLERNVEWYGDQCPDDHNLPGRRGADGGSSDGNFIAAARTAVPALIDEVERLRSALLCLVRMDLCPDSIGDIDLHERASSIAGEDVEPDDNHYVEALMSVLAELEAKK